MQRFIERFGALFGAASIIGIIITFAIEGDPPDVSDKTVEQIVAHWVDLGDGAWFAMWLGILVGILMLLWGLWTSNALRQRGVTILTPAVAVGSVLIAIGIAMDSASRLALLDAAEHMPTAAVVAVSAMLQYLWLPFLFGMFLITIGVSASAKQTGLIPSWLAWVGYATALILVIPHPISFIGFPVFAIWVLLSSVIMFRRTGATT
ncbi:MAG TPA: hypothetical protein DGF10_05530 [Acidimicrobiaceae bacterium]|nr:hypothetical protein [Acidimicrobiaceae bacterium]HAQ24128.1 hypothetical protein [Acidimicrobiaceae bacterium]HCV34109.1 hypothetical protein [Acidimicrobiaceae bacterium]